MFHRDVREELFVGRVDGGRVIPYQQVQRKFEVTRGVPQEGEGLEPVCEVSGRDEAFRASDTRVSDCNTGNGG